MTKDNDIIYIDSDIYYQITGIVDEKSYQNFLDKNPRFKDINKGKQRKSVYSENIVLNSQNDVTKLTSIEEKKKTNLEFQHEKDEDYRYFPHRIWLEQHLPKFEKVYGKFFYSSENLTNKRMCEELLSYYSEVCHIENVEDIKNPSASILKAIHTYITKLKQEATKKGRTH